MIAIESRKGDLLETRQSHSIKEVLPSTLPAESVGTMEA